MGVMVQPCYVAVLSLQTSHYEHATLLEIIKTDHKVREGGREGGREGWWKAIVVWSRMIVCVTVGRAFIYHVCVCVCVIRS